jgi:hypothetical protein
MQSVSESFIGDGFPGNCISAVVWYKPGRMVKSAQAIAAYEAAIVEAVMAAVLNFIFLSYAAPGLHLCWDAVLRNAAGRSLSETECFSSDRCGFRARRLEGAAVARATNASRAIRVADTHQRLVSSVVRAGGRLRALPKAAGLLRQRFVH